MSREKIKSYQAGTFTPTIEMCRKIEVRALESDYEKLNKRLDEAVALLKDIRDNYDCDIDAHRYGTSCRCCMAVEFLAEIEKGGEG